MFTPEFWVAASFLILLAVFGYIGVHRTLNKALDDRHDRIKAELDEARRLKEEAAALLADYKRRQQDAESEAAQIIATAQAEAQAVAEVRAAAAEAATAAAERILTETVKGKVAADLLAQGIEDVKKNLN